MDKYYITTAIPYANAKPHIGFALEALQCDCLARYNRLIGKDVYFLTGTDEHGMKIADTAEELKTTPQEHVDKMADLNKSLKKVLNLSYDDFIRTTSKKHKKGAQKLWKKLVEAGDIYKGKYKGYYCKGCEAYVLEKELEDGKCPIHKKKADKFEEENYFFHLSKYSDRIVELIESDELKIMPGFRKKEFLNIAKEGLTDVSFSRPKEALKWGVEVPGDESQIMYVWCDALSNYITALDYENEGELFQKYWPADVHMIGKDITRFHAGYWIGMLLSAGIEIPKSIYIHGFITSGGHKMSKSLNNVIDPFEVVEKYGADATRYYLLKEIPTADDGDFTYDRFEEVYNSDLANNLGNLLNRVVVMTHKYFDGKVPEISGIDERFSKNYHAFWHAYNDGMNNFNMKSSADRIVEKIDELNKYIEDMKPWELAKENKDLLAQVMYNLLEALRHISIMLYPFIPEASEKMMHVYNRKFDDLDIVKEQEWGVLQKGEEINKCKPLFPRLEG